MTEQEYADIAAACDRLLRAPSTSLARLAIPALHLLNEHPSSLAQYEPLLKAPSGARAHNIPKALIRAARGLAYSIGEPRQAFSPRGPIDAVIVSHLMKPEQLQQSDDFYFGSLQSQLNDLGVTSLLLLIDHLSPSGRTSHIAPTSFPRVVLPAKVSPAAELNIWRQCVHTYGDLRREAASSSNTWDRRLALLASEQVLSASVTDNLRMHGSVARICEAVNPKMVITTYEGSVAERLIWSAARRVARRPLCVGYQHALVLKRAHAIRRPVAASALDCDPDIVLTLGDLSHTALATSPGLRSVRLIRYGSHRRTSLPELPQRQDRPRQCLVLPDADARECTLMFDFALNCARHSPDISFVLRPHPMVDTAALLRRQPALQELPPNVALSVNKPLVQELAQARYCLYRGSSAAMYAVLAGIKPYYLAQSGELPFDCLSELAEWREVVTSPEDLTQRMSLADRSTNTAAARHAAGVCERYVAPVRPAAINELLLEAVSSDSVAL